LRAIQRFKTPTAPTPFAHHRRILAAFPVAFQRPPSNKTSALFYVNLQRSRGLQPPHPAKSRDRAVRVFLLIKSTRQFGQPCTCTRRSYLAISTRLKKGKSVERRRRKATGLRDDVLRQRGCQDREHRFTRCSGANQGRVYATSLACRPARNGPRLSASTNGFACQQGVVQRCPVIDSSRGSRS
jgi:hypothetical protein